MRTAGQDGFTLIEILIALTVFSIAILGITAMQSSSIRGNQQARVISEEVLEAVSQVEALRMLAYDDALLAVGTHSNGDAAWDVALVNGAAQNEYKTIEFTLSWTLLGNARSYTINFIKSSEL